MVANDGEFPGSPAGSLSTSGYGLLRLQKAVALNEITQSGNNIDTPVNVLLAETVWV